MSEFWSSVSSLLFNDADTLLHLRDWVLSQAGNIILALFIFLIGRYVIKWVRTLAERVMTRSQYDPAAMSFVSQMIHYVLLAGLILLCLNQLGFATTSFIAAFGAFGLGLGLALQNNLSNLASGLLILLFKPFKAGHYISVGDLQGNVQSIQFMNTIIVTKDQKRVYIPNSLLTTQAVTNFSYMKERMIPFVFDIGYQNDHHQVIEILKEVFESDKRVLNSKGMEIGIQEFGDNSVQIAAFAKVKTGNYVDVRYSIMSAVKDAFDKNGIDIPYPQRVVYMHRADSEPLRDTAGTKAPSAGKQSDSAGVKSDSGEVKSDSAGAKQL